MRPLEPKLRKPKRCENDARHMGDWPDTHGGPTRDNIWSDSRKWTAEKSGQADELKHVNPTPNLIANTAQSALDGKSNEHALQIEGIW